MFRGAGNDLFVLGAGGHAKVVLATALAAGWNCVGLYDDDVAKHGTEILGVPVLGSLPGSLELKGRSVFIGFGGNAFRRTVALRYHSARWVVLIHPETVIHPSVRLGEGTVVFAGAIIQPDATIGCHCIINTAASVDHDCSVGDFAHVAPGAHLAGNVHLGPGVFMGVGTSAIPGVQIGSGTVVGAGATVVDNLPANVTAVGTPARPIKERPEGWQEA